MKVHGRYWVVGWVMMVLAIVLAVVMGRWPQTAKSAHAANPVWIGSDTSLSGQASTGMAFLPLVIRPRQLKPPKNVAASDEASTDWVRVTWSPVSRADYYEVHRAPSEDGAKIKVGTSRSTGFIDVPPSHDTWYYYWVTACNGGGCSDSGDGDWGRMKPWGGGGDPPTPPIP